MLNSVRGFTMKTAGALAALLFLLTLISIGSHDLALATTFTPTENSVTLSNSTPSANSNFTVTYTLDSPSSMEDVHLSFIPPAWSVANDAAVPDGAIVGGLSSSISESVSNGPCNDSKFLNFTLYDSTTNTTSNLLSDTPRIPDAGWPGFADANSNSLPDAVDKYPTFLTNLYPGLTPRSRAYGSVDAAIAGINRVVNVLVFDPGTSLPGITSIDPALGYIVVAVWQDPTAPAASSSITDQCTTFTYTRMDRGLTQNNVNTPPNEAGFVYRTNPAASGTYTFVDYLRSHRDFDNDGIENRLDTCPYVSTASWNPRISDAINDPDGDGIPGKDDLSQSGEQLLAGTGCDPTPLTAASDPDADGLSNREDNCPLMANAPQDDPDRDGIGSTCDTVVTAPDGHLHEVCAMSNADVGTPGSPPALTCPEFVPDMDSDGFSRTVEEHVGTNSQVPCGVSGWSADFVEQGLLGNNRLDIVDLNSFLAPVRYLDTDIGEISGNVRWDIVPGPGLFIKDINIADFTKLLTLFAPMQEGERSFNGPPCPWP
jgi:hypothetical protein